MLPATAGTGVGERSDSVLAEVGNDAASREADLQPLAAIERPTPTAIESPTPISSAPLQFTSVVLGNAEIKVVPLEKVALGHGDTTQAAALSPPTRITPLTPPPATAGVVPRPARPPSRPVRSAPCRRSRRGARPRDYNWCWCSRRTPATGPSLGDELDAGDVDAGPGQEPLQPIPQRVESPRRW